MHLLSRLNRFLWTRAGALACVLCLSILGPLPHAVAQTPAASAPALMLAKVYHPGVDLADYWVSEKYDGLRGYWDGQQLFTRGGERVQAPAWFTAGWPNIPLDGELWAGRGQFAKATSTVRQLVPNDAAWRGMKFMVFDVPAHGGPFTERITALNAAVAQIGQPWVVAVVQTHATTHAALQTQMHRIVKAGGEGLVLHRGASLYTAARNDDLLKVKPHEDAEAKVLGHQPGQGKYTGMLGALLVESVASGNAAAPGVRFKIGTGLSDAQRRQPPPVGSVVTYRYRGLTDAGVPRFASFVRVAQAEPVPADNSH
ncbi:MAG: DNA ligase [Burkholderiales bacterium PBB3]|nr:MAG: DNA ligase [Burkholderiales bacterium PBB3]